jgi:hypothetical protein
MHLRLVLFRAWALLEKARTRLELRGAGFIPCDIELSQRFQFQLTS